MQELAELPQRTPLEDGPEAPRTAVWRLVLKGKRGKVYLENIERPCSETGFEFVDHLLRRVQSALSPFGILFRKPAVYVVTLSSFANLDVCDCRFTEIIIAKQELNSELTGAFARPELLADVRDFAIRCQDLIEGTEVDGALKMRKALLVDMKVDRASLISYGLAFSVLSSTVAGLVVGLITRRASDGSDCAAMLFTLIQIMEAFMFWMY